MDNSYKYNDHNKPEKEEKLEFKPKFYVTTYVNHCCVTNLEEISDPFLSHFVTVSWWDRFKSLFSFRAFIVEVVIEGNESAIFNVMTVKRFSRQELSRILINNGITPG